MTLLDSNIIIYLSKGLISVDELFDNTEVFCISYNIYGSFRV